MSKRDFRKYAQSKTSRTRTMTINTSGHVQPYGGNRSVPVPARIAAKKAAAPLSLRL